MRKVIAAGLAIVVAVLVVGCEEELARSGANAQSVARARAAKTRQLTAVLRGIHDQASAQRAAPAITRICEDMALIERQANRLPRGADAQPVGYDVESNDRLNDALRRESHRVQQIPGVKAIIQNAMRAAEEDDRAEQIARHRQPTAEQLAEVQRRMQEAERRERERQERARQERDRREAQPRETQPQENREQPAQANTGNAQLVAQLIGVFEAAKPIQQQILQALKTAQDGASAAAAAPQVKAAAGQLLALKKQGEPLLEKIRALPEGQLSADAQAKLQALGEELEKNDKAIKQERTRIGNNAALAEPLKEAMQLLDQAD